MKVLLALLLIVGAAEAGHPMQRENDPGFVRVSQLAQDLAEGKGDKAADPVVPEPVPTRRVFPSPTPITCITAEMFAENQKRLAGKAVMFGESVLPPTRGEVVGVFVYPDNSALFMQTFDGGNTVCTYSVFINMRISDPDAKGM